MISIVVFVFYVIDQHKIVHNFEVVGKYHTSISVSINSCSVEALAVC